MNLSSFEFVNVLFLLIIFNCNGFHSSPSGFSRQLRFQKSSSIFAPLFNPLMQLTASTTDSDIAGSNIIPDREADVIQSNVLEVDGDVLEVEVVGNDDNLVLGDIQNMEFTRLTKISAEIAKYRLNGLITSKECNSYLEEYKAEMKRRKVKFPGFRPGLIPPYAMTDVRRYIVCYGLEINLGTLCNNNGLIACTESGDPVKFGSDEYYSEIFLKDSNDRGFLEQRDAWREGTDFEFALEFYAKENVEEEQ